MKCHVVIITSSSELNKILTCFWTALVKKLNSNISKSGMESDLAFLLYQFDLIFYNLFIFNDFLVNDVSNCSIFRC